MCRSRFQASKDNIARVMAPRTREPTDAELAETRAHLARVRDVAAQQQAAALAAGTTASPADTSVQAAALMLDPKMVAAALSRPNPTPPTPPAPKA